MHADVDYHILVRVSTFSSLPGGLSCFQRILDGSREPLERTNERAHPSLMRVVESYGCSLERFVGWLVWKFDVTSSFSWEKTNFLLRSNGIFSLSISDGLSGPPKIDVLIRKTDVKRQEMKKTLRVLLRTSFANHAMTRLKRRQLHQKVLPYGSRIEIVPTAHKHFGSHFEMINWGRFRG